MHFHTFLFMLIENTSKKIFKMETWGKQFWQNNFLGLKNQA